MSEPVLTEPQPKDAQRRVLVADPISQAGVHRLSQGAEVDVLTGLPPEELIARIPEYDALVVRSETQVTEAVLEAGKRLKVVARAGVGVDNIDVPAATRNGVVVVNSPEGNTIAAAEHSIAMLLSLSRRIPAAAASLAAGEWKRSRFVGVEVYNKTLGVIGFGKIGREVARRGRGLGMRVLAADAYVSEEMARREGVELVELPELYSRADFITVHTPLTRDTRGLLNDAAFAQMKEGVRVINCARGGIIEEAALMRALEDGKVAGAALDVFEEEPPKESPLIGHPRVVGTPHLGASTEEAQINVALDVADQILIVLEGGPPRTAVNMPAVSADVFARIEPFLALGVRIGRLQAQLANGPVRSVAVTFSGDLLEVDVQPVTRGVLMGLLQPVLAQSVNFVNAPYVAEQRGIRVTESKSAGEEEYPNYLCIEVEDEHGRRRIGGTVLGRRDLRIREIDEFSIDLHPEGHMLLAWHRDRPGIIGAVGTLLGAAKINIAGMFVGRREIGQQAIMVLTVDEAVPEPLQEQIKDVIQAEFVRFVDL